MTLEAGLDLTEESPKTRIAVTALKLLTVQEHAGGEATGMQGDEKHCCIV
ncbi:hypothetical protein KSF_087280 [Reticulibacter mediterranei]|uniref:Uncharacterized protein n=1 Tax=Reticulibacter mediterranei TaxID=2778369 RepID=A0A8J3N7N9_9CHLR|nr:hypothetical protein KSF_087280 [Reticulibacter mediterranei]